MVREFPQYTMYFCSVENVNHCKKIDFITNKIDFLLYNYKQ